jgi:hypothetical protein
MLDGYLNSGTEQKAIEAISNMHDALFFEFHAQRNTLLSEPRIHASEAEAPSGLKR